MPHLASTIEALAIKPLAQPDNYGNTFRVGMKFGEDWYSYGTIKKDQLDVKVGNDWITVTKGMEVEFMYKVNGDFKNVEKKSFTVTNQEGGVATRQDTQQAPQGQQASKGSYVNAAEIGQCLNLAVEVLKLDSKQLLDDEEVTKAIAWYKATREKFHELYVGVEASATDSKPKPKPKPKPAPAPVVEDSYDDDLI